MKPGIGYPKVFSRAFNTLIDVLNNSLELTEDSLNSCNWLLKRHLLNVNYPSPGNRKYKATKKSITFIKDLIDQDFSEAELHEEGIYIAVLLIHLKTKEKWPGLHPKSETLTKIFNRLGYLKLINKDQVTEKGEKLLNIYYQSKLPSLTAYSGMLDNSGEPYSWWSNWLIDNAPDDGWAIVLLNSGITDKIKNIFQEKLIKKFNLTHD